MTKNTFTICFKSKEFVGPPLILPITSPVTPYGPGCQFTWSPATASRLVPASTLPPADSAQRGRQAGTPASAQNLSVVPTVAQKARQGVHDLPVTALTPSPPPSFLTPSVPATLASGGFPCLQPHFRTLAPATPPSYMLFPQIQVHFTASSPSGRYSKVTSP